MNWTPRWHHVTQWGSGEDPSSGSNNCAEASIARALLEYDPSTPERRTNQEWNLIRNVHDEAKPDTVQDIIDRVSILARGAANGPWNGFTSADGIQRALSAYGLKWRVTYTNDAGAGSVTNLVRDNESVLCWVAGQELSPTSYSGSFFGGDWGWDHIILSLPDGNLFNDPLTDVPSQQSDVRYGWDAIGACIGGVWVLPPFEGVTLSAKVKDACALKSFPNHLGPPGNKVVIQIPAGTVVRLNNGVTPHWQQIMALSKVGWVLKDNLEVG